MFLILSGAALVAVANAVVRHESANTRAFAIDSVGHAVESTRTSVQPHFDCDAGFDNWAKGWSTMKTSFCCEHFQQGCSPEAATELAKRAAAAKPKDMTGMHHMSASHVVLQDPSKGAVVHDGASLLGQPAPTPGVEFLGQGYDLLRGNLITTNPAGDQGWRLPVFQLDYTQEEFAADSVSITIPQGTYYLPTPACTFDTAVHTVNSLYEYINEISGNFHIGGNVGPASFKLGVEAQNVHDRTENSTYIYLTSQVVCSLFEIELLNYNPPALSPGLMNAVNELPTTYDSEKYNAFLDSFGTAFVQSAKFGGRQGEMTRYSYHDFYYLEQQGFNVKASVGAAFQAKLGLTSNKSIESGVGLNASSGITNNQSEIDRVISTQKLTESFNVGGTFSSNIQQYQFNLAENPAVIYLSTDPIYTLLGEPYWKDPSPEVVAKQSLLKTATLSYCAHVGATSSPPIANPCSPAVFVPPFTVPPSVPGGVNRLCITNSGAYLLRCKVYLTGEGVQEDQYVDTTDFSHGEQKCVEGPAIPGIKNGDQLTCDCSAVAGRTVPCGVSAPYYNLGIDPVSVRCDGTTLSIECSR